MSIFRIIIATFSVIFLICVILILLSLGGFFGELEGKRVASYMWNPSGITTATLIIFVAYLIGIVSGVLALITGLIYFIKLKLKKRNDKLSEKLF